MSKWTTLAARVEGRIGRLTLDQPDQLNPLGTVPLTEIADAAAWFDTTDASIVVVTGAGRAFSSGFDLREFADDTIFSIPEVNAALENVATTAGAWADADQLGAAMRDPEARAAAREYLARRQA